MTGFIYKKKASSVLLAFFMSILYSQGSSARPLIAIVIDDIGVHYELGKQAIELDAQITYALLPFTKHAKSLADYGLKHNKEFILHSPMQSIDSRLHHRHALHMHMTEQQFLKTLTDQLTQFPFIRGINNHMGSLLTRHAGYMNLLMKRLKQLNNFYFVDSRTTAQTIAIQVAQENNVPAISRDIFLDTDKSEQAIKKQLNTALQLAKKNGHAVVIAHPYKETLDVLKNNLNFLKQHVDLVNVSTLLQKIEEPANEKSTHTLSAGL